MPRQDGGRPSEELPVLLKLQRKVKELEQNKQSLWERLDKKEGAPQEKAKVTVNHVFLKMKHPRRNMASLSSCQLRSSLSVIYVRSCKKELAEQITVGRAELDLEKLKVPPDRGSSRSSLGLFSA